MLDGRRHHLGGLTIAVRQFDASLFWHATADQPQLLFRKAFAWVRQNNSAVSYDVKDTKGVRYQIKARRLIR
jgi:hypothetical protein